jgi:hypothetical protein
VATGLDPRVRDEPTVQTHLACLAPPKGHTTSRFMNQQGQNGRAYVVAHHSRQAVAHHNTMHESDGSRSVTNHFALIGKAEVQTALKQGVTES